MISRRLIRTSGNGVTASGNCNVEIHDSHIIADGVGVFADWNSDVEIYNSIIEGGTAALEATGNSDIVFEDSTILGPRRARGNADITDAGGSRTEGRASTSGHGEIGREEDDEGEGEISVGGIRIGAEGVEVGGVKVTDEGVDIAGGVSVDSEGVVTAPGGIRVEGDKVDVGDVKVRTGPGGDTVVDVGGESVTVESRADGSVRITTPDTVVTSDWRSAPHARYRVTDTERILLELGAKDVDGETQLQLAGDVLFDFDSAAVRADAAATLGKLAHVLRQVSAGEIRVIGHTDAKGEEAYNQRLSERRAVAVMRWLNTNEGIPAHLMVGRGMGEKKPIDYNAMPDGSDNPQGRAKNRRVEIRFASER